MYSAIDPWRILGAAILGLLISYTVIRFAVKHAILAAAREQALRADRV
jgi:hypothetical protein